jgi:hypothetical protein
MGGESSMLGMIISYRNNRNLLKNKRKPFNKDKMPEKPLYHRAFKDKYVSKVKLMNIRRRLQEDKRKETLKLVLALFTAAGIGLIIMLIISHYIVKA